MPESSLDRQQVNGGLLNKPAPDDNLIRRWTLLRAIVTVPD
jgi:hypothetical protein